ncbi:MAG: FtsQ-type POTRA domain-containing protein [Bacilli bacterium]|nr:FtsQ-type POTRA domain-containing protein [Bacilli bacterium]
MKNEKVKMKRKLKLHNVIIVCLFLFIFSFLFYYFYQMPIKNIIITGTTHLTDQEIIETAEIRHYPKLFQMSSREMKDKLKTLSYVEDVQIKKSLWGRLTILIKEEIPVFYNRTDEHIVCQSGKIIKSQELHGVPILINYVPDELYRRLISEIKAMNMEVLALISEIEYQPWKSEDIVVDDTRFFLRMNDGNVIYVNLINWTKLNNYMTIYSTLGNAKGVLQLDSSLGNGITFTPF